MKHKGITLDDNILEDLKILSALNKHRSVNQTINIAITEYVTREKESYKAVFESSEV